ncbi:MAG: hypothetical protein ACM3N0_07360 [Chloroflexota bacterium]
MHPRPAALVAIAVLQPAPMPSPEQMAAEREGGGETSPGPLIAR